MTLKRRKRERSGIRDDDGPIRCPGHLKWVRGFACLAADELCGGAIEAAHIRYQTDGGASQKPGDSWAVPLCHDHHARQHTFGEVAFWGQRGGIESAKKTAQTLWRNSPHGRRYRMERDGG